MPIFEYSCEACRNEFELLVRNGEPVVCPQCDGQKLEKLLSAAATHAGRAGSQLPVTSACPPSGAPPCGPGCCRL